MKLSGIIKHLQEVQATETCDPEFMVSIGKKDRPLPMDLLRIYCGEEPVSKDIYCVLEVSTPDYMIETVSKTESIIEEILSGKNRNKEKLN